MAQIGKDELRDFAIRSAKAILEESSMAIAQIRRPNYWQYIGPLEAMRLFGISRQVIDLIYTAAARRDQAFMSWYEDEYLKLRLTAPAVIIS